ncbi:hypothetical protein C8F01DRAFT_1088237 [Mycena amicta]|nr:hypothetical protein C8F01DRAFT_1088237 [Mycena amicta]
MRKPLVSLLRAQSICIFEQASLAYENMRLLRTEYLKIELEEDFRSLRRCSWIKYLPAAYRLLRKIAQCTKEVKDIAHRIHCLFADEKKRKLAHAENDAKQHYATLCSAPTTGDNFPPSSRRLNYASAAFEVV